MKSIGFHKDIFLGMWHYTLFSVILLSTPSYLLQAGSHAFLHWPLLLPSFYKSPVVIIHPPFLKISLFPSVIPFTIL